MERLRCFIEDKTPISGICCDESPIIRTRKGTRHDTISSLVFLFYVGVAH
ncbi:MAG: hypothetical protein IJ283_08260 [Oscillospiraceae bacterium]|nr:hypothetical protein [Oscillospiraceae bacterium]